MDPEFLDPGPDQPPPGYGPRPGTPGGRPIPALLAPGAPGAPGVPGPGAFGALGAAGPPAGRREVLGLLVMLVAATGLPFVASFATLYSVLLRTDGAELSWSVDAWGHPNLTPEPYIAGQAPRFAVLLVVAAAGFALLVLIAAAQLLGGRAASPARVAGGIAGAATGLVGLLTGVTATMTLEIQSTFDGFRSAPGGFEVRMRVGDSVWLSLAGILAGGLSVTAALRVRRAFRAAPSGY